MASVAVIESVDDAVDNEDRSLTLFDLMQPGINIAELLDENELNRIGQAVVRDVDIDDGSRGDWLKNYRTSLDAAMQVKKPKNFPWPKAANIKYPLLTVASIQFQARAYPAIVDGSNLVKGRVLGPDPDGNKRARADRIGQHMTWQLLYRMPGWEEETDKLLLMLPIMGCVFRKTYYDAIENANRSEMVSPEDFVINYWAKSIETAPRYTHILHYYPYEVLEKVASGQWLPVPLDDTAEHNDGDDEQGIGDYYEQHRTLDLDGDGFPEHYVVTCTTDGKVARIVPCFGPENVTVMVMGRSMRLDLAIQEGLGAELERVIKIERRQYFTKYGFIPAPDGSFYDIGFGSLLENLGDAINTLLNQVIDAASLQNAGGGFLGSGINIRGGNFRFALGEWKRVDITAGPLKDNIMPMPAPGPSAVSFNLLDLLIGAVKEITAVQDVLTGQSTANQPATTTLALIEQGQKVMTGIFKRIHRAFGQELRILRRLNRDYLDEEEYFQLNDPVPQVDESGQPIVDDQGQPLTTDVAAIGREDYADEDLDVIPVSDPQQISDIQKMTRAQALLEAFNGDPLINQKLLRQNFLEAAGVRDIKAYFDVPEPPPDPRLLTDAMRLKQDEMKNAAEVRAKDAASAKALTEAAKNAFDIGLTNDAASFAGAAQELAGEIDEAADSPAGPGAIPEMGGEPGDEGIPDVPQGLPGEPDEGLGFGQPGDAGPGDPGEGIALPGIGGPPV